MLNKELPAETAAEKTTEVDVPTSSPTIGNTIVVGSQSEVSPEAGLEKTLRSSNLYKDFDVDRFMKLKEVVAGMTVKDAKTFLLVSNELISSEAIVR